MINVRRLAGVDMALHGQRIIIAEFALGVLLTAVLGFFTMLSVLAGGLVVNWQSVSAFWLFGTAANYVPLLIYAVLIARGGTVQTEGKAEMAEIKRYSVQQFVILIPFVMVILALLQERRRKSER